MAFKTVNIHLILGVAKNVRVPSRLSTGLNIDVFERVKERKRLGAN